VSTIDLKTDVPHSARVYDYLLGGKDNFAADREAAAHITGVWPNLPVSMRANRNFMTRVARYLAAQRGIRQFLDIGTGLPTSPNLHEVVQEVAPAARVVYIDNDPIVLVHARALLTSSPEGRTTYVDADLREPERILAAPQIAETLDLSQPVAVCLLAIMHYIVDEEHAHRIVETLMAPMPPGSALALSTATADTNPEEVGRGIEMYNARGIASKVRTRAEVTELFRGLELVEPGVALVHRWHPDEESQTIEDERISMWGGVGIKP
jgi:O-methyltransferase involved in polyketide biosynthesis